MIKEFFLDPPLWFIAPIYLTLSVLWYDNLALFSIGLFLWTFLEYISHRWILHSKLLGHSHRVHHIHQTTRVSLPLLVSTLGLGVFYLIFYPLLSGLLAGYVIYEIMHRIPTSWHKKHHYNPKSYFNVSFPIWDLIIK